MNCARSTCSCRAEPGRQFELDGKIYCCEKCARECTDEQCVCVPCDCSK